MRGDRPMKDEKKKVRVAAYCRVSTEMEIQEDSYDLQMKYYTDLISQNPDMELVGVYGDRGRSGLNTEKRPGLQSLLDDCRAGKIDLILSKSVSRFARNMADFVEIVRELRKMGINMYFEKERIDTKDKKMDWVLDTLALVAEEESNSISLHMREAHAQSIREGRPYGAVSYGYRSGKDRVWIINGDEAARVRRAFYMAGEGNTYSEIRDALNEMEGGNVWRQERLKSMLQNVTYKGDYYANKNVTLVPGKSVPNNGLRDRYYLKGHHTPIVSEELFDKVQENIEKGVLIKRKRKEACNG